MWFSNIHMMVLLCSFITHKKSEMKYTSLILLATFLMSFTIWQADFKSAKKISKDRHLLVLLNFSGSDWCGPCIRMKREIFADSLFLKMSDTSVVMYNADFPRMKKNILDKKITKENEELADKYNPEGKFPYTLLINEDGKVIKSWDGFPEEDAAKFTQEVSKIANAYHNTEK